MNVLITGATGFLGSHLAKSLLRRGDHVMAYARKSSNLKRLKGLEERIEWFDVSCAYKPLEDVIDAAINTAACYGRKGESEEELISSNVLFPLAVLNQCRSAKVPLLNISTSLPRKLSAYAMSKAQFVDWTSILDAFVIHLRMEMFYGPGDDDFKFVERLLRQMIRNVPSIPLTAGDQERDFIFVEDAAQACLVCLDNLCGFNANETVEVGSGEPVSLKRLVEKCKDLCGSTSELSFGEIPYRRWEPMVSTANIERLGKLGWRPGTELEEGLKRTINAISNMA